MPDESRGASAESRLHPTLLAAVGYGTQDDSDAGSYGVAFGMAASLVPVWLLHVGAHWTFHVGSKFGDEQNRVQFYGLELGTRLGFERLAAIPYLASGLAVVESQRNVEPELLRFYVSAGARGVWIPIEPLVIGIDLRYALIPSGSEQADSVGPSSTLDTLAVAGIRF